MKSLLNEKTRALKIADTKLSAKLDSSKELRQDLRQVEAALESHKREAEQFSHAIRVLEAESKKQSADAVDVQLLREERESANLLMESLEAELRQLESKLAGKEQELLERLDRYAWFQQDSLASM
jgi:chromosome segregation ATPase